MLSGFGPPARRLVRNRGSNGWAGAQNHLPEMSATEAQLGLAYEFEFEFDLKFDDRVRVRVPASSFRVPASGFEFRIHFWGSVFGFFSGPFGDPFSVRFGIPGGTRKGPL